MEKQNLLEIFKNSIIKNWNLSAFSDYLGAKNKLTYGDLAARIALIHEILNKYKIKTGNKIAVTGKNSANWATSYMSAALYGAVVVPILSDFSPNEIAHIINHSDTVIVFCSDEIFNSLKVKELKKVRLILSLNDFRVLYSKEKQKELPGLISRLSTAKHEKDTADNCFKYYYKNNKNKKNSDEEILSIVYTSGTTGFSKGVILQRKSLLANIVFSQDNMPLKSGDTILSFLPLAHSFGCTIEFLFPFSNGCHITFLDKLPSPTILIKAFAEIKPRLILSVPLIIEKIYGSKIKPLIEGKLKIPYKTPVINNLLKKILRKKLEEVFGGNFIVVIVGGAALNPEVESFFRDIKFRYTVGYGMTECGPLISYASWDTYKKFSVGRIMDYLEIKTDSKNPETETGEIMVKGMNVMKGYYKNPKETAKILKKGWLLTGDLGIIDKEGNIFIRGRKKSMLLSASGQNIYPEELEAKLNVMPLISESLVVDRDGKLTALIYPDMDKIKKENISRDILTYNLEENRKKLNSSVSAYSSISKIEIMEKEFEKTPSKKIKRFLYN